MPTRNGGLRDQPLTCCALPCPTPACSVQAPACAVNVSFTSLLAFSEVRIRLGTSAEHGFLLGYCNEKPETSFLQNHGPSHPVQLILLSSRGSLGSPVQKADSLVHNAGHSGTNFEKLLEIHGKH